MNRRLLRLTRSLHVHHERNQKYRGTISDDIIGYGLGWIKDVLIMRSSTAYYDNSYVRKR